MMESADGGAVKVGVYTRREIFEMEVSFPAWALMDASLSVRQHLLAQVRA
jgi:hypothetical protein